ncbi:MAG: 23S rRNA (guanosine(2251)-2'-O)-methyltransferase RlmB [Candidatus Goldiibacteriota bacterium]
MLIYGRNVIREIIASKNRKIRELHAIIKIKDADDILAHCREKGVKTVIETREQLNKYTGTEKNQGIAAVIDDIELYSLEEFLAKKTSEKMTLAVLDEIEDPHNFGAILRSCEVLGVCGIIIASRRSAPVNDTVFKVSSGALDKVPVIQVANINNALEALKKDGFWIYGLDLQAEKFLDEVVFDKKSAIVLGNEGSGIRQLVKKNCDFLVKIRQAGTLDSLNVSNAAAIVFYQAMMQRIKE